jgi:hypothetical protein
LAHGVHISLHFTLVRFTSSVREVANASNHVDGRDVTCVFSLPEGLRISLFVGGDVFVGMLKTVV